MENASKALIWAAEILVGIMIISIAVYVFTTMGKYSAETAQDIEDAQIAQFNSQFLKYYGTVGTEEDGKVIIEPIKCTIHDIVGLANLAKKENERNGFTPANGYDTGIDLSNAQNARNNPNNYVQIDIQIGRTTYKNIENWTQDELINLVKNYSIIIRDNPEEGEEKTETKYFICKEEPIISDVTRKVDYMKFVEFN